MTRPRYFFAETHDGNREIECVCLRACRKHSWARKIKARFSVKPRRYKLIMGSIKKTEMNCTIKSPFIYLVLSLGFHLRKNVKNDENVTHPWINLILFYTCWLFTWCNLGYSILSFGPLVKSSIWWNHGYWYTLWRQKFFTWYFRLLWVCIRACHTLLAWFLAYAYVNRNEATLFVRTPVLF